MILIGHCCWWLLPLMPDLWFSENYITLMGNSLIKVFGSCNLHDAEENPAPF